MSIRHDQCHKVVAGTMEEAYKMLDKYGGVICECPNCDGTFGTDMGLGIYDDSTVTKQAQKRILEKAIERLEGKFSWPAQYGLESQEGIAIAIAELKSLMGEV